MERSRKRIEGMIRQREMEVEGSLKKGNQANDWAITGPGGKFMKIYS